MILTSGQIPKTQDELRRNTRPLIYRRKDYYQMREDSGHVLCILIQSRAQKDIYLNALKWAAKELDEPVDRMRVQEFDVSSGFVGRHLVLYPFEAQLFMMILSRYSPKEWQRTNWQIRKGRTRTGWFDSYKDCLKYYPARPETWHYRR